MHCDLLFCSKIIKYVNYNTKSLTILLINQSKDSSKEDFELLQQKIEQLKEAEKVKTATLIFLSFFRLKK